MPSKGLILEGISGAGKTSLLKTLVGSKEFDSAWPRYDLFREKETFGEFMAELMADPGSPDEQKLRLLERTVETASRRAEAHQDYRFIMERAHFSYYALLPRWELYAAIDTRLAGLGATVVLLELPKSALQARTLERVDRDWSQGFIELHGSKEEALKAFAEVQRLRREAVERSALRHIVIDTSAMEWRSYARRIVEFISSA